MAGVRVIGYVDPTDERSRAVRRNPLNHVVAEPRRWARGEREGMREGGREREGEREKGEKRERERAKLGAGSKARRRRATNDWGPQVRKRSHYCGA